MADKIYPEGLKFFKPNKGAPEWVRGQIVISPEFIDWLNDNRHLFTENEKYGKQLRLLATDRGAQVDTYKPKEE